MNNHLKCFGTCLTDDFTQMIVYIYIWKMYMKLYLQDELPCTVMSSLIPRPFHLRGSLHSHTNERPGYEAQLWGAKHVAELFVWV